MYKLIGNGDINNILEQVLTNRGVDKVTGFKTYLEPSVEYEESYKQLNSIDLGLELFMKHVANNNLAEIALVVDRDLDGMTSSAIIHNYMNTVFPNVTVNHIHHDRRENGLTKRIMSKISRLENKPNLVILPDASSNDKVQHEYLNEQGIDVLVLDHHEVNNEITDSPNTVVINPQLSPDYENKQIAGVGVTYRFLQALDDLNKVEHADDLIALVALGNISDSMDLRYADVRSIVMRGLPKMHEHKFINEAIFKLKHSKQPLSIHALSWSVLPKINALIRVGDIEDLDFLYGALRGLEGTFENTNARSEKNRIETWEKKAVRLCINAFNRQKTKREKIVEDIVEFVNQEGLNEYGVLIIPMKYDFESLTGYVAGNVVNRFDKSVALMSYNEEEDLYYGSIRGLESNTPNFKTFLEQSGAVEWVRGHEMAAGICIKPENLDKLYKYIETTHKSGEDVTYEVDFVVDYKDITPEFVKEIDNLEQYWCKGVEPPVFYIKNARLPLSRFKYGEKISKFEDSGLEIGMFSTPTTFAENEGTPQIAVADIVGKLSINRFYNFRARKDMITPQILCEGFNIEKIEAEEHTFGFDF